MGLGFSGAMRFVPLRELVPLSACVAAKGRAIQQQLPSKRDQRLLKLVCWLNTETFASATAGHAGAPGYL